MPEYSVITKSKCKAFRKDAPVTLDSYIIAENSGGRIIMLRFRNRKQAALTRLKLNISCFDKRGAYLGTIALDEKTDDKKGRFVLNKKIEADGACAQVSVEVVAAWYGGYCYDLAGGTLSYSGGRPGTYDTAGRKNAMGGRDFVQTVHRLSSPVAIGVLALVLIACVTVFTVIQLFSFISGRDSFREDGVVYTFVTDADGDYEGVTVTGYEGLTGSVSIPQEVGGYTVLGIASDTFRESNIKSLTIEGDLDIEDYAFYGCTSLRTVSIRNVTNIGRYAFYGCSSLKTVDIGGDDNITVTIAYMAFGGCASLNTVNISSTVIFPSSGNIFSGSSSLETLSLYNLNTGNNDAFTIKQLFGNSGYSSLRYLTVHKMDSISSGTFSGLAIQSLTIDGLGLATIPDSAFYNCFNLETLQIPNAVTSIGSYAFANSAVTYVDLSAVQSMGSYAFYSSGLVTADMSVNTGLSSIPDNAFNDCDNLVWVNLPYRCTSIGEYAFYDCTSLVSVSSTDSLTEIGEYAFAYCISLSEIDLEGTLLQYVGECTFIDCDSLTEMVFPSTLRYISSYAFCSCGALGYVELPLQLYSIGDCAFSECFSLREVCNYSTLSISAGSENNGMVAAYAVAIYTDSSERNSTLHTTYDGISFLRAGGNWYAVACDGASGDIIFGDTGLGYYQIASYAFYCNDGITSAVFGTYVTGIGKYAFYGCGNLKDADMSGSSITSIGSYAFAGCAALESADMPYSLDAINSYAFSQCSSLREVVLRSSTSIGSFAFEGCSVLYEVFDLGGIGLVAGSAQYGYVAYNALYVYTDINEERRVAAIDDYLFFNADGSWQLISYTGYCDGLLALPSSFTTASGTTVGAYSIADYAFDGAYVYQMMIPVSVDGIEAHAFSGMANDVIYYGGTESDWYAISSAYNVIVYFYSECVHDGSAWTYDTDGSIITDVSIYEETAAEADCNHCGTVNVVCSHCGEVLYSYETAMTDHNPDSSGKCTICGEQGEVIGGSLDSLKCVEVKSTSFEYADGTWYSVNGTSSTAQFTITAKEDIYLYLTAHVSAYYNNYMTVSVTHLNGSYESYTLTYSDSGSYIIELEEGDSVTVSFRRSSSGTSGGYENCGYIDSITAYPW